jgi:malate dehydrogenase
MNIIKDVAVHIRKYVTDAIVIVVTNPLDTMTYALWKLTELPSHQLIGMAGELDRARFKHYIACETGVDTDNVQAMVLGSHGDLMVPLVSHTYVKNQPLANVLQEQQISCITERTRGAGGEIIKLSRDGSGFYAAASCITHLVDCILNNKKDIMCCSVKAGGEYKLDAVFVGLPAVIGAGGVERIIELTLQEKETWMLNKAAQHLSAMQIKVDNMLQSVSPVKKS